MSRRNEAERFWEKVDVRSASECWEWLAYRTPYGYGQFGLAGGRSKVQAHRWSLAQASGECPEGKTMACHTCDNRGCVNPAHLYWGTARRNARDMVERGRQNSHNSAKTQCIHGHELAGENLYVHPATGYRYCKLCQATRNRNRSRRDKNEYQRRWRAARKTATSEGRR